MELGEYPFRVKWLFVSAFAASLSLLSAELFASSDDVLSVFYSSSRIFQTAPTTGITVVAQPSTDVFLVDGVSEDLVMSYVFMPPAGTSPESYAMSFSCDDGVVVAEDACVITNAVASIVGTSATAYNTTVTCTFDQFPGATNCGLTATLIESSARLLQLEDDVLRQTQVYESPKISFQVYGVVFYIPDRNGGISANATIVSGSTMPYTFNSYDRTDQGVREILVYASAPGLSSSTGSTALNLLSSATISTTAEDRILNYDPSCLITNATATNGVVELPSPDTCGIGIAGVSEDSYPRLGFQFRTYKSGNLTFTMSWSEFGSSAESYDQSIVFEITENAPPVITSVDKKSIYRSVPCESETLVLTAYNVRYADNRTIVVKNSDDSTSTWLQTVNGFSYDSNADISTLTFESAGGLGTNVEFTLQAVFGTDTRTGIVLDPSLSLTLSFSSPPTLTSMRPTTTAVDGGDSVVLTGSFEGFDSDSIIYIGGYTISAEDFSIDSSTQLTFTSPALASLGLPYTYEVAVGICAETSSSVTLSYEVSPSLTITAVNSSVGDTGSYFVPLSGSASFLAEVSGNNNGAEYIWKIFSSSGEEINIGGTPSNLQVFTASSAHLASEETHVLACEVKNSLELTDYEEISIKLTASVDYLLVNVYTVENLTRSADTVTLVQSSVQVSSDSGSVVALQSSEISLEWTYMDQKFEVDNSSASSDVSGPTQLGLEFNIARNDLRVGSQDLRLFAFLTDNPIVSGSDTISIHVMESDLIAVVNNGVNGTLILEGNDLLLYATNSSDPDILEGEGDATDGLEYEWISCRKSLRASFSKDVEDCSDIFPSVTKASQITILAADLSTARLDTSSDPDPTFFSFGVRVSKSSRTTEAYSYFELQTVAVPQKIPALDALQVVDVKGVALVPSKVSLFGDVIVLPESADGSARWTFDMVHASQKFLFSKNGVLKTGEGFTTSRGISSRGLLGFASGSLKPSTEYKVKVSVSALNTSLESDYEVTFKTADVPTLKCNPPSQLIGIVSETRFTISAQLSFETQSIEYCFHLVSSPTKKYTVGKGCSSVPFAEFSFPIAGEYDIECIAKTVSGAEVDKVTIADKLILSTPAPVAGSTVIQTLTARLNTLNSLASSCEATKDHTCLETLISGASAFAVEVSDATQSDTSDEAQALIDGYKTYFERMSALSSTLASKTIYRPNQLMESIDQAFYMSQVPAEFVEGDATLFAYLKSAEGAANSSETDSAEPVVNNLLVEKMSGLANLSLSTSSNIVQEGTTRRRLLQDQGEVRQSFAAVLNLVSRSIAVMRAQQETCGYTGRESSEFPTTLEGSGRSTSVNGVDIPPLEVNVHVSCTRSQISKRVQGSKVSLRMCEEALGPADTQRVVIKVVGMPSTAIEGTGLLQTIKSYAEELAFVEVDGLVSVPADCLEVIMARVPTTLISTEYDNLVGGTLDNLPTADTICTPETCYTFDVSSNPQDGVSFSDKEIVILADREGLFIAGNRTAAIAIDPRPPDSLDGFLSSPGTQFLGGFAVFIAFIIFAVLFVWLSVSNFCVMSAPDAEGISDPPVASTAWEYVERDPFAREQRKNSLFTETELSTTLPDGARPPETGPLSPKAQS